MRYTDIDTKMLQVIRQWARNGLTREDIGRRLGVTTATLISWRKKNPLLEQAVSESSDIADSMVENALYTRAVGYPYSETIYTYNKTGVDTENPDDAVKVKRYTRYMPADVTACIYWLKNRKPEQWSERKESPDTVIEVKMDDKSREFSD